MIDHRSLEIFYWVARLGGFRRAATRLCTTQPAVSARISQMEQMLKVRLIERQRRHPLTLTRKGAELMSYAERILRLHGEMMAAMTSAPAYEGIVRLGVSETIVHTWLPELVRRLHADYPGITIEVSVDVSPVLKEALSKGDIDIAFMIGAIDLPKVRNIVLNSCEMVWAVSPQFAPIETPVTLSGIAAHPILTFSRTTEPYQKLKDLLSNPDYPLRIFPNTSLSSIIRMTLDGIGIGAVPAVAVTEEVRSGRLRILDSEVKLPSITFTASYIESPDAAMVAMIAKLAEEVATQRSSQPLPPLQPISPPQVQPLPQTGPRPGARAGQRSGTQSGRLRHKAG